MMFIDGTCPECGGHTYNKDGGPLYCEKCGWEADAEEWATDMKRLQETIGRTIDVYLAGGEADA